MDAIIKRYFEYEMKIPTSGTHSPHDLKFGFYKERPPYEKLVHNLEHGDIIIHYHPDAPKELLDQTRIFNPFHEAGAGVLAVPNPDVPAIKRLLLRLGRKQCRLPNLMRPVLVRLFTTILIKVLSKFLREVRLGGGTM